MKTGAMLLAVAALSAIAVTPASANSRYHHYRHHHHGYGAYARGHRPTGPGNPNFEMGSGWNNGSPRHPQYGRPDHN
jgi:hypothetical protein